eukprot:TRINITY_DN92546_c0_g1_i1.p1 TRINITY_DN92546_c0_g1~~TRINITY_DN92546_c0_g1_i1.p1  ORF type:complete len:177 (+),score=29.00 TRINITY_DN92546_c0_g1_i1:28-531(+)
MDYPLPSLLGQWDLPKRSPSKVSDQSADATSSTTELIKVPECKGALPDADAEVWLSGVTPPMTGQLLERQRILPDADIELSPSSTCPASSNGCDSDGDIDSGSSSDEEEEYDPKRPLKVHCNFDMHEEGWLGMKRLPDHNAPIFNDSLLAILKLFLDGRSASSRMSL